MSKLLGYGTELKNVQLKAGIHQIKVLVTDGSGLEAEKFFILNVEKAITLHKYCKQSCYELPV